MAHLVKFAEPDEILPGKGKTLLIEGREVTVVNLEGRYAATATLPRQVGGALETSCEMPGHHFDATVEHSPARLRSDELHYRVMERDDGIYVLLEEGHVHPGEEPRGLV